jgi:predicted DCC family thiol-disulfide oxidoreductase YuxK
MGRLFASRGFEWTPLQTPGAAVRLGVAESAFDFRMHLLTADGRVLHNADALGVLCRSVWWLWPLGALLLMPGFREVGRITYDWFARNRNCIGGTCRVDASEWGRVNLLDWTMAILLPAAVGFAFWNQSAWLLMWALVAALGLALKWLTWRDAIAQGMCPSVGRAFVWFTLWPGMDGRAFFLGRRSSQPELREWFLASAVAIVGAIFIWGVFPPRGSGCWGSFWFFTSACFDYSR